MIKRFWTLAVVKDWKKNIVPVIIGMALQCCIYSVLFIFGSAYFDMIEIVKLVLFLSFCTIFVALAGTITSLFILPKRYLAVIPQLSILPIGFMVSAIVFGGLFGGLSFIGNDISSSLAANELLIITAGNIMSVIIVVCLRLIYELYLWLLRLLRRARGAECKHLTLNRETAMNWNVKEIIIKVTAGIAMVCCAAVFLAITAILALLILYWIDDKIDAENDAANRNTADAAVPLTIDGDRNTDVYLQSLDINVEVTGNIAATRYTMVFKNKTNRVLEAELTFPLPEGRSATHYALDINGKMREAVPVEKSHGTKAFEEIKRRRVDPGLLEKAEGGYFRSRVYPIPAKGARTISIGYEEELAFENGMLYYRLPTAYQKPFKKFSVNAAVLNSGQKPAVPKPNKEISFNKAGASYTAAFERKNYRPSGALVFALPIPADTPQILMQSAQGSYYFLASAAPKIEPRKKLWADDLAIIWDASLSGLQRNLQREIEILDTVFAEKKEVNVYLYFLNNKLVKQGEYNVTGGNWSALKNTLKTAVFDGGTDFSQIKLNDIAGDEILFFSDGNSTLSGADFLKGASDAANRPIHCIASSAKADYSVMKFIADETNGKFVNAQTLSPEKLKNELLYEPPLFLGAEYGDNVREVYPGIAAPVYGNISIAGIADTSEAELTLLFGFGDTVEKRIKVRLDAKSAAAQGNIHKIWAQKKIAELDLDYGKNSGELRELGRHFGIVTRNTSLIVLETVDDYVRYNIEPPESEPELLEEYRKRTGKFKSNDFIDAILAGNRSLMSGGDGEGRRGVAGIGYGSGYGSGFGGSGGNERAPAQQSSDLPGKSKSAASADVFSKGGFDTDIDAILSGTGGLRSGGGGEGRRGVAGIGYGSGYGSGFGGSGGIDELLGGLMSADIEKRGELKVSSPDFLKGGALTGGRSRAAISRIVIRNTPALRYAYNSRLRDKPGLNGKITVKFAIDESGKVIFAQVVESTVDDPELERAVADRVKSWYFDTIDKPGDVTEVVYPFVFSQGADEQTADTGVSAEDKVSRKSDSRKPVYMKKLTGKTAGDYEIYLKVRNEYVDSPGFYYDMADWFYTHGDRETALRALTSIADLELDGAARCGWLGYKFKEYGEYALEKFVCGRVLD